MTNKACHPITDVLHAGMYSGRRAFVVGGGPSLAGFPFERLKGEIVIACNRAYECGVAQFVMGTDRQFWLWHQQQLTAKVHPGQNARGLTRHGKPHTPWQLNTDEPLLVFSHEHEHWPLEVVGYRLNTEKPVVWGTDFREGVIASADTGLRAINFADLLGCSPIYMLGFDMRGVDGATANWHGGYERRKKENVYDSMMLWYTAAAASKLPKGQIINLGPNSRIECFPSQNWREVLP